MANLLPILLLGGAAVIMMSGSKGSPKPKIEPEPEPDPEPEPAPEPEPEPGIVMEDRDVVCFKKTAGNVEKSLKMKDAILEGIKENRETQTGRNECIKNKMTSF